ncbi:hypothetical protein HK100_009055, partial [Physocladia obscura]
MVGERGTAGEHDDGAAGDTDTQPVDGSRAVDDAQESGDSASHFLPGRARVFVKTMGCSHNVSDGEYMAGLLKAHGYAVDFEDARKAAADVWLLNSCTVKGPSEAAFDGDVRRALALGKRVVVAGCVPASSASSATRASASQKRARGHVWDALSVVGVHQIDRVVEVVEETLKGNVMRLTKPKRVPLGQSHLADSPTKKWRKAGGANLDLPKVRRNPWVEIIPINTGCLNQCTYCKTKHARGDLGSYSPDEIWERCESVILEGVKEIWLTSEDTGAYGRDIGVSIVDLLWGIIAILEKYPKSGSMLRVGMTNPPYILEHLDEMVKILSHPRVFSFLHVPVQSGSNTVLDAMRRQYTVQDFTEIVTTLRENVSPAGCTVATDVICGFPTETDSDFEETMVLLRELQFNVLHISQFYSRPGTPAALMPRLSSEVVKSRSRAVSALFNAWLPYEGLVGVTVDALVTEISADGKFYVGHDKLYRQILVPMDEKYMGRWVHVEVVRTGKFFLEGKVLHVVGGNDNDDEEDEKNDFLVSAAGRQEDENGVKKTGKGVVVKRRTPKLVNVAGKMVKMTADKDIATNDSIISDGGKIPVVKDDNDDGTVLSVPESYKKQLAEAAGPIISMDATNNAATSVQKTATHYHSLFSTISVSLGVFVLLYGGVRAAKL